jgi:citrate synthase
MTRMLESDEAARRLGVKVTTLYAYVSRGLLASHRAPVGRRSLFDIDEVERLARRSRQGKAVETRMATVTTGITHLTEEGPIYRGRRATDLAVEASYEDVAEWLWDVSEAGSGTAGELGGDARAGPDGPDHFGEQGLAWTPLPLGPVPQVGSSDRMRWAVVMAGAGDPLRADLRPEAIVRTARRVAATMVAVLPPPEGGPADGDEPTGHLLLDDGRSRAGSMAERLASRLSPAPTEHLVRGVNAALVLLADHELATSTMAVRVAASTRADICDALLAGLGTLAGPLHGGASQLAFSMLVDAERNGIERTLDDTLRWQGFLPGFGHAVYKDGDPRFTVLWELFVELAPAPDLEVVQSLITLASDHSIPRPNVDLGLAAMAWATGMPPDAGRTLFTVARVAGWAAHYLEELGERPLRYRARAVYASHRA